MRKTSTTPSFDRFAAVRSYQPTLSYSPDSREIAYSVNTSGQFNLWRQPVSGGYPHQVTTFEEETVRTVGWSPDGDTFLFLADRQGDEFTAPHFVSVLGGEADRLTNEPEVRYDLGSGSWSADGRFIHYAGNDREPTEQDLIVREVATGNERRVLTGGLYQGVAFSPDGRYISAVFAKTNTDFTAYVVDLESGEATKLPVGDDGDLRMPGPWLPDSSGLYVLTNHGREFLGAGVYDLASGSFTWDLTPDWDLEELEISADGSLMVWV
ncbi:MAG: hypothetical protein R2843_16445, partial [Thermomicrobiales bacterium]